MITIYSIIKDGFEFGFSAGQIVKNARQCNPDIDKEKILKIYRIYCQIKYNALSCDGMLKSIEMRPYWQYIVVMDNKSMHSKLNGVILTYDNPFWSIGFPPNNDSCRCRVVSLSKREIERDKRKVALELPFPVENFIDQAWMFNPFKLSEKQIIEKVSLVAGFDIKTRGK